MGTGTGLCLSFLLLCMTSAPALAQNGSRGEELYENHCRSCHESWAHERKGHSAVSTPQDLRRRVAAWATHVGLDWTAEDVDDVSAYLDQAFYHFDARQ